LSRDVSQSCEVFLLPASKLFFLISQPRWVNRRQMGSQTRLVEVFAVDNMCIALV
jgi:hypothetical protein